MKAKSLLKKAKEDLKNENEEKIVEMLKKSLKEINDCKKTLKKLEKKHKDLLETDIEDLELENFEY